MGEAGTLRVLAWTWAKESTVSKGAGGGESGVVECRGDV